ncbi:thiamine pyrophosphate-binding protein [Pseudomonas sp. 148P]|uniref:Thiamine pyrophosphate-binding protein n=1 Tax=Pseudomonas ulcerans TaxID=3115852 RepID=A0ABU7HYV4_9PSED|nr:MULTISPECIES: thiamine pyrophosphate-binding protein [unclassified Pseudomonas]MEE1925816.1 thiamine pyrophosphate-binding protein [Pseudomonas sp. 147P]MEE1936588.1 thiamine pyrophosphate-binding protein [Pseudomonas sp. 148P]
MSKDLATPAPSGLGRFWRKWRFHLNILLILVPLGFMPRYFAETALFRGDKGLGQRVVGEVQVGPWSLTLAELKDKAPELDGVSGYMKGFNAALCDACAQRVKATYLRIGKPRSLRAAGVIFFGSAHRQGASLPVPQNTPVDAQLWITMEGWDGSVHQAAIPLEQASPKTVEWLAKAAR